MFCTTFLVFEQLSKTLVYLKLQYLYRLLRYPFLAEGDYKQYKD